MSKTAKRKMNRFALAALVGLLVWLADQPTVSGYNPLLEMLWDPGVFQLPFRDCLVLGLSWFVTTLFTHFVLFSFQKIRSRGQA